MSPELRSAYAACRRAHRRHDPTYYYATRRLPAEVRPAVHALYAFVREADELVDGPGRAGTPEDRRAALDALEADLAAGVSAGRSHHAAIAALADAARRHDLPLEELGTYMDSMRIDCAPVRIATWDELIAYMNGSAAAVGRIMAPLLGASQAHESIARLGLEFQLTNFIRDVREDYALDRIYLPGMDESEIAAPHASDRFRYLLAEHVQRARDLFREGAPALAAVEPGVRPGMRMARAVYVRILDRVEVLGYDVLGRRAGLRPWELGAAALGALREPA